MNTASKIVSVLFHPLVMPMIGLLLIFNTETPASMIDAEYQKKIYLMVLFSTAVIPLSVMPFFLYQRIIRNVEMDSSRERIIPFLITCVFYYVGYYLISRLELPHVHWIIERPVLVSFLLSSLVVLGLVTIITIFWKISVHMAGIGGICGAMIFISVTYSIDMVLYFMIATLVSGLLGVARLKLNAHNPLQVYSGFLLGVATVLLTMFAYYKF